MQLLGWPASVEYVQCVAVTEERKENFAKLASVLSSGARAGQVRYEDAGRVLRHELRRMNTRAAKSVPPDLWSAAAKAALEKYEGDVPPNGSTESLHCDHAFPIVRDTLKRLDGVDAWLGALPTLMEVVVVTAKENYALQRVEREHTDAQEPLGVRKYELAKVTLVNPAAVARLTT